MISDSPSRKRPLTAEEAELWLFAMRQAKTLQRRDRERRKGGEPRTAARAEETAAAVEASPPKKDRGERTGPAPVQPERSAAPQNPSAPPPLSTFDERQRRKLAKAPDLIEARLDLHGMRQREAHSALTSFLRNCTVRGLRHVLVITGKGSPESFRTRDFYQEERGVLRRLVPMWLAEPELRSIVVSYTASHVRHGGEGALYVRLRKGRDSHIAP